MSLTSLNKSHKNGRGERIRTSDPLVPNQVRYQTALRPELLMLQRFAGCEKQRR
jgi:hypothetical protein